MVCSGSLQSMPCLLISLLAAMNSPDDWPVPAGMASLYRPQRPALQGKSRARGSVPEIPACAGPGMGLSLKLQDAGCRLPALPGEIQKNENLISQLM